MNTKAKQVSEILNHIDQAFPGERTVALLHEYACVLANFPMKRLENISNKIIRTSRRWWTLDEWENENDKIAEEEKVIELRKHTQGPGLSKLPLVDTLERSAHSKLSKICCKTIREHSGDCKAMGEALIEAEKELPGKGLLKAGNDLKAHGLKLALKKSK